MDGRLHVDWMLHSVLSHRLRVCTWRIVRKKKRTNIICYGYTHIYLDISTANESHYIDLRNATSDCNTKYISFIVLFYHHYYNDSLAFIINQYCIVLKFTTVGIKVILVSVIFIMFPAFHGTISRAIVLCLSRNLIWR